MSRPFGSKNLKKKKYCKHGHRQTLSSRYEGGQCKTCVKQTARIWAKDNPQKVKDNWHRWLYRNVEKENDRLRRKSFSRVGWTPESFDIVLKKQKGLCALCGLPFTKDEPPCADHEHISPPKPRGLLHRKCNSALGMLDDSFDKCLAAAKYLRKWKR